MSAFRMGTVALTFLLQPESFGPFTEWLISGELDRMLDEENIKYGFGEDTSTGYFVNFGRLLRAAGPNALRPYAAKLLEMSEEIAETLQAQQAEHRPDSDTPRSSRAYSAPRIWGPATPDQRPPHDPEREG